MRAAVKFHKHFVTLALFLLISQRESLAITTGGSCGNHFSHETQKCMRSFQQLYSSHQDEQTQAGKPDDLLTKHLCFEYEKTLLCLHVALSSCATVENTQRVQRKLSSEWVIHVNQLCHIQSGSSYNETNHLENRDYLDNTTDQSDEEKTNIRISDTRKFDKQNLFKGEKFVRKNAKKMWRRVVKMRKFEHSMVISDTQNKTTKYKIYTLKKDFSSSGIELSSCNFLVVVPYLLQQFLSKIHH